MARSQAYPELWTCQRLTRPNMSIQSAMEAANAFSRCQIWNGGSRSSPAWCWRSALRATASSSSLANSCADGAGGGNRRSASPVVLRIEHHLHSFAVCCVHYAFQFITQALQVVAMMVKCRRHLGKVKNSQASH